MCTSGVCFKEVHTDGQVVKKANAGLKVVNEHEKYARNEICQITLEWLYISSMLIPNITIWGCMVERLRKHFNVMGDEIFQNCC